MFNKRVHLLVKRILIKSSVSVRKKEFQELVPSKCDDPEINSIELNIYFFYLFWRSPTLGQ